MYLYIKAITIKELIMSYPDNVTLLLNKVSNFSHIYQLEFSEVRIFSLFAFQTAYTQLKINLHFTFFFLR